MNQLIPTSTDEQGNILVSGRDLHGFLEVGKDFSTWFKDMTNYGFEEGKDFTPISGKSNGGRPRTEYAMTLDMAKEISMIQRNDKGKQARQYFIEVEKEYKQNQIDVNELSPELKMFNQIFQTVAANELENKKLNHKVDNIAEIVSLNTTDWRKTSQSIIKKIAITQGGYEAYRDVAKSIYDETDKRAGSNLKTRLTNLRKNMALEGASKSKRDKANKLDVIESDKRLKEIYMAVVKDMAIKNKVWENEY
ncbi:antA/AntB antirepressor family protein [Companilactobacillus halodurans]|uniref:Phage antirepressor Ant n=1 Tax=Companilactobacillus halodurans TaxID=2584183 RepID=A0A5P0ZW18_9LACO|nr:antA/AntB antirepressor family protein [Companilactobacillus halodurans]MQS97008.1 phage antirepressor Ant [Companilactobacillus halodurans]